MDLDSMKYAELRGLAKQLGLKSNMKADKLIKAIKHHSERTNSTEGEKREAGQAELCNAPPVFVNTRRGRSKAKRSSAGALGAVTSRRSRQQGVSEVVSDSPTRHVQKRRRVSSPPETEVAESERLVVLTDTDSHLQRDAKDEEAPPQRTRAGRIPCLKGYPKKRRPLKPVTPNFRKLHQAHFNKMESIDAYMQRKQKKVETAQELKAPNVSLFSPTTTTKKKAAEGKRGVTILSAGKEPPKKDAAFRPPVLSTRRMNVRFSEATPDNEYKMALVKTPSRVSFSVTSSTPQHMAVGRKSACLRTPATFVFTGNASSATPGTQKKPTFDLKASLSRPLSYKPHTGKLKPFGDGKEHEAANTLHQKKYKQHKVQTREERQAQHEEDRKQKKSSMLCARRGLVMM